MEKLPRKLQSKLTERLDQNAVRALRTVQNLVDFSSNDYLGFAREEAIADRAATILQELGTKENGATGSRLLTGNHKVLELLESFLAKHHKVETALVFNSGYDANLGFFSAIPQRGDLVFYDELIHASIRDGIKMGNAKSYKFKHNNLDDLKNKVEGFHSRRSDNRDTDIYVVTESVFSMDGDSPDLRALAEFCAVNGYYLVVDEAHATGIYGNGTDLTCELGIEEQVFARIITFGKALGCHGAAVLGSNELKTYLVNFARSLIYTTAMSPHSAAIVLGAYHYMKEGARGSKTELQKNIDYFKEQIVALGLQAYFRPSESAIHCLILSGNEQVKTLSKKLHEEGFDVRPILSPTVKAGQERLRFCLHTFNTKAEISRVLHLIKTGLK